jgi:hypothetical protein
MISHNLISACHYLEAQESLTVTDLGDLHGGSLLEGGGEMKTSIRIISVAHRSKPDPNITARNDMLG